jgi:hypothetical protein
MAERPKPGRIYDFLKALIDKPAITEDEFKEVIDKCFPSRNGRPVNVCRTIAASSNTIRPCCYSAFILGEFSHDGIGEQEVAIKLIDHLADKFNADAFVLKEEASSGDYSNGLFSTSKNSPRHRSIFIKHKIRVDTLAGDAQFSPEEWVPAVMKSSKKLISYTGSAHTCIELPSFFKNALPRVYNMDPGKTVLRVIHNKKRKGLVAAISMADEFMDDFEEQAYREKLHEFPDPDTFDLWLSAFKHDMHKLLDPIKGTKYYKLANDIYFVLVGPYGGLKEADAILAVWKDKVVQERIRKQRHWTLYDLAGGARFEDDKNKGRHFIKVNVDLNSKTVKGELEEQWF